ncbi:MAG: FHA domain-containing protein [Acidobacteria bacterium]|nr:FHA domain-containing protein [Acidobacteriota bacterium]
MKIVLAEEQNGSPASEKTFSQPVVRIGRDPLECQITFDNAKYPMVSRKHAELRFENGKWYLYDLNSSYGTYLNGQRVGGAVPVSVGGVLQFGTQGPTMRVVWFEAEEARIPAAPVHQPPQNMPQPPQNFQQPSQNIPPAGYPPPVSQNIQQMPSVPQSAAGAAGQAKLDFIGSAIHSQPFPLVKPQIWLGRDPSCDVVFEADAVMVSRRHATLTNNNGEFLLTDNNSFNGTLVNGQRISTQTPVYHSDEIQLGVGGPVMRFNLPSRIAPKGASLAGQRGVAASQIAAPSPELENIGSKTMVANLGNMSQKISLDSSSQPTLLMSLTFGSKQELTIGRAENNDIVLDGLQISNRHARLVKGGSGISIEDFNSTNGVYINGTRITRQGIFPGDAVQIGSFLLQIDQNQTIGIFDTRSKTRIDSVNITKEVKNRSGGGMIKLLDNVSLSIQPNEFVGLLGPSGAGKSTFMDALNGMRPASGGSVLINNLDLYQHLDSLKQSIGYVPQDDIIHRELTVYRTLYYVAKLRLSGDVSRKEIDQIIEEVMDVTGLSERRDVPINQLSGGQRKRVSIAVELITKPSVIFLDEPTSGLDPATEEKIMVLFRQIAESGRTVILTTHAMENVKLFDKIVLLMRGKLAFYGRPDEALKHLGASSFKDLYDKLEEPIETRLKAGGGNRHQVTEQVADEWKQKFMQTPQYRKNVYEPLKQLGSLQSAGVQKKRGLGVFGAIRQFLTLSRRYWEVLFRDKLNLFILFAQSPIIAFLTYLVMGADQPRDFAYFVLSLVAVWFGTSVSAREIIRERPVYNRERMVNLGLLPYVMSKLFVLGFIVGLQCMFLFLPLKFLDLTGLMPMPGDLLGIPQLWAMLLTAGVGIALGLLISGLVKTSEMATSLVPLILIPQILFSGLVGIPSGLNKVAGLIMPATWAFDTMKEFSGLKVLREDGDKDDKDRDCSKTPCGLYKKVEWDNKQIIKKAEKDIAAYKDDAKADMDKYKKEMDDYQDDMAKYQMGQISKPDKPKQPEMKEVPKIDPAKEVPKDLSGYVDFLHPWMNEVLNQIVLMLMFFILVFATLIVLRMQDIG